jgi:hypothetical protein
MLGNMRDEPGNLKQRRRRGREDCCHRIERKEGGREEGREEGNNKNRNE